MYVYTYIYIYIFILQGGNDILLGLLRKEALFW